VSRIADAHSSVHKTKDEDEAKSKTSVRVYVLLISACGDVMGNGFGASFSAKPFR
jgi:hypothetical protein